MHEDVRALQVGQEHLSDRVGDLTGAVQDLAEQGTEANMHRAIVSAIKEVLSDPDVTKKFWKAGFDEFTSHAGNGAAQWVGKRIIAIFLAALLAGSIVWMVQTGKLG